MNITYLKKELEHVIPGARVVIQAHDETYNDWDFSNISNSELRIILPDGIAQTRMLKDEEEICNLANKINEARNLGNELSELVKILEVSGKDKPLSKLRLDEIIDQLQKL